MIFFLLFKAVRIFQSDLINYYSYLVFFYREALPMSRDIFRLFHFYISALSWCFYYFFCEPHKYNARGAAASNI